MHALKIFEDLPRAIGNEPQFKSEGSYCMANKSLYFFLDNIYSLMYKRNPMLILKHHPSRIEHDCLVSLGQDQNQN